MKNPPWLTSPGVISDWRKLTGSRRGMINPLPLMDAMTARAMQQELFARFNDVTGLGALVDCMMIEPEKRPIPHAFEKTKVAAMEELASEWAPRLMAYALSRLKSDSHTLNNKSNLGNPYFGLPESPAIRVSLATEFLARYLELGPAVMATPPYDKPFKTTGLRLQTDPPDKEREFLYVDDDGAVYAETKTARERSMFVGDEKVVPARTRTIVQAPVLNVFLMQILDTRIHNVWLEHPVCHHNMFAPRVRYPERQYVLAYDQKNFDRYVVAWSRARAEAIGGDYAVFNRLLHSCPYLVASDTGKSCHFIHPNEAQGFVQQFGSGLSDVACCGKEVNIAMKAQFAVERMGLSHQRALEWALQSQDGAFTHLNYGDDNIVFGSDASAVPTMDGLMEFMNRYVETVPEEPAAFLGFRWNEAQKWFELPVSSYLRKTFLPERGVHSVFRKYPCAGWVERRDVFRRFSDGSNVIEDVFAAEDEAIIRYTGAYSWANIVAMATSEHRLMRAGEWVRADLVVTEKDYLLTEREKVETGRYSLIDQALVDKVEHKLRSRN